MARIIHTDNFGGDYPDEKFVEGLPSLPAAALERIVELINTEQRQHHGDHNFPRYYRVVADDYELQPGFEP